MNTSFFRKALGIVTFLCSFCGYAQQWQHFTVSNSNLPTNQVFSLAQAPDETIWAATSKGLAYYARGQWKTWQKNNSNLPAEYTSAVAFSKDGYLWAAFPGIGVARLKDRHWELYSLSFLKDTLQHLQFDKNNYLWAWKNTGKQVHRFDGVKWNSYTLQSGCAGENFQLEQIVFDAEHKAYIQTVENLWSTLGEGCPPSQNNISATPFFSTQWIKQRFSSTWPASVRLPIRAFTQDENGQIWIATDFGIATYKNNDWITYSLSSQKILVHSLLSDNQGNLWLGTESTGIFYFETPHLEANKEIIYLTASPNPFQESTIISYNVIASPGKVLLYIQDQNGQRIATLVDEVQLPGNYETQ
ncbi:MAG: two-component regulator propeller domain-containing protein [Bacteroidia bacterium]|nr:hypothetical protein [Bacteroidia bacterium]MDW8158431.1 two-component regulator propeller domain-containing protein [Bacteroidia bacterium]